MPSPSVSCTLAQWDGPRCPQATRIASHPGLLASKVGRWARWARWTRWCGSVEDFDDEETGFELAAIPPALALSEQRQIPLPRPEALEEPQDLVASLQQAASRGSTSPSSPRPSLSSSSGSLPSSTFASPTQTRATTPSSFYSTSTAREVPTLPCVPSCLPISLSPFPSRPSAAVHRSLPPLQRTPSLSSLSSAGSCDSDVSLTLSIARAGTKEFEDNLFFSKPSKRTVRLPMKVEGRTWYVVREWQRSAMEAEKLVQRELARKLGRREGGTTSSV